MLHVNTFSTPKWTSLIALTLLLFLSGCEDTNSITAAPEPPIVQASPLETETPDESKKPPSYFQCDGENFDNSGDEEQLSEFSKELDLANWPYEGKTKKLNSDELGLMSSITKNEGLGTLSLRSKEDSNFLFRIQQEPFHGFLQAGVQELDRGGWTICQGRPETFQSLQARPISCFALWKNSNGESQHFLFAIGGSPRQWQIAFEVSGFQLDYQATEHFILYKLHQVGRETELASAMTDRYFNSSHAVFNLHPIAVSIDCKSEAP